MWQSWAWSRVRVAHTFNPCTAWLYTSSGWMTGASPSFCTTFGDTWMWWLITCQGDTSHQCWVDSSPPNSPSNVAPVGSATCQPLFHIGNHLPAHVHLTTTGSRSVKSQCLVLSLKKPLDVPASSFSPHWGGFAVDTVVTLPGHTDCTSVAISTLVSAPALSLGQPSTASSTDVGTPVPTAVPNLPPGSIAPVSVCVEVIKWALVHWGYSSLGGSLLRRFPQTFHRVGLWQQVANLHGVV